MSNFLDDTARYFGFMTPDVSDLSKAYDEQTKLAIDRSRRMMQRSVGDIDQQAYGRLGTGGTANLTQRNQLSDVATAFGDTEAGLESNLATQQAQLQASAQAEQRQRLGQTIGTVGSVAGLALPFLAPGIAGAGALGSLVGVGEGQAPTLRQKLQLGTNLGALGAGIGPAVTGGGPNDFLASASNLQGRDPQIQMMMDRLDALLKQFGNMKDSGGNPAWQNPNRVLGEGYANP